MSEITPAQKTALLKLEGFKEIRDQYAKEQKMAGAGKRRMKGGGFWNSVLEWFKSVGTSVNDFLKRTKIISNVAGAVLPILAPMATALLTLNPIASAASVGAAKATAEGIKSLGYGAKSMHMMPDGSMMKGKIHGGMMMKGGAIDPSLQALGKFGLNLFSPLAGMALQTGLDLINKPPKMKGKGNEPLSINPPDQRMRGVNPKSTMRGAGKMRGKGEYTTADIDGVPTLSMLQNRKMRSISMSGEGYGTNFNTMGVNGVPQVSVAPANPGMIRNIGGKGMMKLRRPRNMGMGGTEYGSVSSSFGNVQF
jgi:hypothetical protein